MPILLKSSLWLVSKISFPQDYDIGHPTPISFSSVGLIWFWAPGPLEEPQVHHQPGTFDISAVICRQKHHKKQECWYGEPCFSLETFSVTQPFLTGVFLGPSTPLLISLLSPWRETCSNRTAPYTLLPHQVRVFHLKIFFSWNFLSKSNRSRRFP